MPKIGVMGYSSQKFDEEKALKVLRTYFSYLPADTEIVSGFTDLGIPGLAYKVAREFGFYCTGIASIKAKNYDCFPVDTLIMDDDWVNWGDESLAFLDYCDSFLKIGGGQQSKQEAELALFMDKMVLSYELEPYD